MIRTNRRTHTWNVQLLNTNLKFQTFGINMLFVLFFRFIYAQPKLPTQNEIYGVIEMILRVHSTVFIRGQGHLIVSDIILYWESVAVHLYLLRIVYAVDIFRHLLLCAPPNGRFANKPACWTMFVHCKMRLSSDTFVTMTQTANDTFYQHVFKFEFSKVAFYQTPFVLI